jgi:hypothetical protein
VVGPVRAAVLLGIALGAVAFAGCASDGDLAADWEACNGARTRFFAQAPGLHDRLAALGPDHPMLDVTVRAADHWDLVALEADGVTFPPGWSGALLGSVSWNVALPVRLDGEPDRLPDSTQGFLWLASREGKPTISGELPTDWATERRDAALEAFLANVTGLDGDGRRGLVAAAQWTSPPADSLPSTGPAHGSASLVPVGSGTPGFWSLRPIALPERPLLDPTLGHATAWTEVHPGDGYRQALIGPYEVNVYLPTLVATWDLPAATVEANVDAEDWTRVWVLSKDHGESLARDLHNATLEGAGWQGTADWRVFHEPSAPFGPGQVSCPSSS